VAFFNDAGGGKDAERFMRDLKGRQSRGGFYQRH